LVNDRAEDFHKGSLQCGIDLSHRCWNLEIGKAGDTVGANAARNDAGEVREVGRDVQRNTMERHPMPDADSDGRDFVFAIAARDPDAHAIRAPLAFDLKLGKCSDQPLLEIANIAADIRLALLEVEHRIDHALTGSVIGELSTASRFENGKARID